MRRSIAFVVVVNLAWVASFGFAARDADGYSTLWDGWVFHVATTLPAVLSGARAYTDRRSRLPWVAITVGIVANTAAGLTFTYHDLNLDPVPFPATSDGFYLLSYLALASGLILLTQRKSDNVARTVRLDGVIIGLSTGAAVVALWFDSILEQTGEPAAVVVGLAYPLFDVVFVVIVAAALAPARFRLTPSAAAFTCAAMAFAVGDVIYLQQIAADAYVPGTPLEWSWALGMLLFGVAAWLPGSRNATTSIKAVSSTTLPGLAAFVSLCVVAAGELVEIPALARWLAMAAILAVLIRAGVSVHELRRANEAFSTARTDELTGLSNRRGFNERLAASLAQSTAVQALVIDLNGFKEVNDSLGHQAGDHMLQIVARRFSNAIGARAYVGRLGGDEFGVAVEADTAAGERVARALLDALEHPIAVDGMAIRIGASIGVASASDHGRDPVELLRAADVAMYDAKTNHAGFSWYDPEQDPHSRDRLSLIEELRTAIDDRSFEMHYQPVIDVATRRVVGMEALIRWDHPVHGLLSPGEFIPVAERVGLIPAITRAVLDQSIAQLADMRREGLDLRLSVNISAKDLVDDHLPDYVRRVLDAHEVPPSRLTLEITETALSVDADRAERTLQALRGHGIRISIDDFGVGYSSMSQLLKMPLDELKLDRSFVEHLETDLRAKAVLSATVELGRTLGLDIVAEGIETVGAWEVIADRGVDMAQGYLLARPLSAVDVVAYVRRSMREPARVCTL